MAFFPHVLTRIESHEGRWSLRLIPNKGFLIWPALVALAGLGGLAAFIGIASDSKSAPGSAVTGLPGVGGFLFAIYWTSRRVSICRAHWRQARSFELVKEHNSVTLTTERGSFAPTAIVNLVAGAGGQSRRQDELGFRINADSEGETIPIPATSATEMDVSDLATLIQKGTGLARTREILQT
ncbi:hypothetical protein BH11PLA1_BH11PLA1_02490 [soil metagenome]